MFYFDPAVETWFYAIMLLTSLGNPMIGLMFILSSI
jgi:hypothetical protein